MSGQGYHIGLRPEEANRLTNCENQLDILETVETLLTQVEMTSPDRIHGGYKEWDVFQRCLSGGSFVPGSGEYPLNQCFLGGRLLVSQGGIVNLVKPETVRDVAEALARVSKTWFVERWAAICALRGESLTRTQDSEHFYALFKELLRFYSTAASEGWAIVFYSDESLSAFIT